jgi:hypothetical protein
MKPEVQYRVYRRQLLSYILSQLNLVHAIAPYFSVIYLKMIL